MDNNKADNYLELSIADFRKLALQDTEESDELFFSALALVSTPRAAIAKTQRTYLQSERWADIHVIMSALKLVLDKPRVLFSLASDFCDVLKPELVKLNPAIRKLADAMCPIDYDKLVDAYSSLAEVLKARADRLESSKKGEELDKIEYFARLIGYVTESIQVQITDTMTVAELAQHYNRASAKNEQMRKSAEKHG